MAQFGTPGTQSIVNQTDIALITSIVGQPVRVFSVHLVSDGTASTVILRNGTSAAGTAFIQVDGVVSKGATLDFANGILFPNGCFVDVDSHSQSIVVTYSAEL